MAGDADIAAVAALLSDRTRTRIVLALADERALPASVLAAEAGVAASTASEHLSRLLDAGFVTVEQHGRHRYFRLSGPDVGDLLEALARLARPEPVRSLRQGTRAEAMRSARTCYDHLAGRAGTALMAALLERGILVGGDGLYHPEHPGADSLSAPGRELDYRLGEHGSRAFGELGIDVEALPRTRPLVRYCVDWTEQRHHLAGALGAALTRRMFELDWIRRARAGRAVSLTEPGRDGLLRAFGVELG